MNAPASSFPGNWDRVPSPLQRRGLPSSTRTTSSLEVRIHAGIFRPFSQRRRNREAGRSASRDGRIDRKIALRERHKGAQEARMQYSQERIRGAVVDFFAFGSDSDRENMNVPFDGLL